MPEVLELPPTPDMEESQAIQDGQSVAAMLRDPVFLKAMAGLKAGYFHEWESAATVDAAAPLWAKVRALTDVLTALNAVVGNGQLAQAERTKRDQYAQARRAAQRPR